MQPQARESVADRGKASMYFVVSTVPYSFLWFMMDGVEYGRFIRWRWEGAYTQFSGADMKYMK